MACWICFEECSTPENPLKSHCSCQYLLSHSKCIARWQVQQAGKREEKFCRFCDKEMPNWMDQMCGGKIKKGNNRYTNLTFLAKIEIFFKGNSKLRLKVDTRKL